MEKVNNRGVWGSESWISFLNSSGRISIGRVWVEHGHGNWNVWPHLSDAYILGWGEGGQWGSDEYMYVLLAWETSFENWRGLKTYIRPLLKKSRNMAITGSVSDWLAYCKIVTLLLEEYEYEMQNQYWEHSSESHNFQTPQRRQQGQFTFLFQSDNPDCRSKFALLAFRFEKHSQSWFWERESSWEGENVSSSQSLEPFPVAR